MNFEENAEKYDVFKDVVGNPVVIGEGDYNCALQLSKRYVAKVPIEPTYNLEEEYRNHLDLYHADISVPKPIGIFRFFPSNYLGECRIGLVMEKLPGIKGDKTKGEIRKKVNLLNKVEIEKCLDLGFQPFDTGLHNCIWNEKAGKLYLIDFIGWSRKN